MEHETAEAADAGARGSSATFTGPRWCDVVETPAGWIVLAGRGSVVSSASFPFPDRFGAVWAATADHPDAQSGGPASVLLSAGCFYTDYFSSRPPTKVVSLDLSELTDFTRRVLIETSHIPWGAVRSYGEIAQQIGCPGGARAVGQALGRNPVPILVPCHRVLASNRQIGGFTGGVCWKQRLLRIEGVELT